MREEEDELLILSKAKESGLLLSKEQVDRLRNLQKSTKLKKDRLKRWGALQKASQKLRDKKGLVFENLMANHPNLADGIGRLIPKQVGRPRLEIEQPDLLSSIISTVDCHSSADEKR